MNPCYHLCFAVPDLDRATADLTRTVGVDWNPVQDRRLGDWDFRIVFSRQGPPFFEIIEGPPGSPWDCPDGPRFDHLGYWSEDLSSHSEALSAAGAPMDFDACPYGRGFAYHRLESIGARVELVDIAAQQGFLQTWQPDGDPMPSLPLPGRLQP